MPASMAPSRNQTPDTLGPGERQHLPLFAAARVLHALVRIPGQGLGRTALICYYQLLRAFYTADWPDFTTGGVRAGDSGMSTAFMTREGVTSLLAVERMLRVTASSLMQSSRGKRHVRWRLASGSLETGGTTSSHAHNIHFTRACRFDSATWLSPPTRSTSCSRGPTPRSRTFRRRLRTRLARSWPPSGWR